VDGWHQGLDPADAANIEALFASARETDRRGPTGIGDLGEDAHVLIARVDGSPVGIAWRHRDDPADLVVHPDFRRRGIGAALATTVLDGGGRIWAHANLPAARGLASRLSLAVARELLQLRRSPIGSWPVELPDGVRLRTFLIGQDEEQFLGVNSRAFSWHPEQGRLTRTDLEEEEAAAWFDPEGFFLAVDPDGTVLGFHQTKVHPKDPTPPLTGPEAAPEPIGEVYVLGVDPRSPIRGLGGPLTAAGLNHLHSRGLSTAMLYVESDNEPALKLYRRFGFETYQSDVVYARR
jgi:mycothiol synthase